jgi:hypothetical protein
VTVTVTVNVTVTVTVTVRLGLAGASGFQELTGCRVDEPVRECVKKKSMM